MNRRTKASLLALALLVGSVVVMVVLPVPWVVYSPGPTLNVLDEYDGKPIVDVQGRKEYRDKGALRLLTVISSGPDERVELFGAVAAWLDPVRDVYPYDLIYAPQDSADTVREQSQAAMTSSQDNARAAALTALDIDFDTWVTVTDVAPQGASVGKLAAGDRFVSVNGAPVGDVTALFGQMQRVKPGQRVEVTTSRDGVKIDHVIKTKAAEGDPKRAVIGVGIKQGFRFPFDIDFNLDERIGGPSAGLMFSLTIYDLLTPGSISGGQQIAGTGEVDSEGVVGAIGGVQQKIAAAQRDDARLFLVPQDNCAEALDAAFDPDKMRLVRADNVEQAIEQIERWADDPRAELTECTR